jgi:hypothetical protein
MIFVIVFSFFQAATASFNVELNGADCIGIDLDDDSIALLRNVYLNNIDTQD